MASQDQPFMHRLENDENDMLEDMEHDQHSMHWQTWLDFVRPLAYARMQSIPQDKHEEVVQEIMHNIVRSLPRFRHESAFSTWLFPIIKNCITDWHRRNKRTVREESLYDYYLNILEKEDTTGEEYKATESKSVEETFEAQEEIRKGIDALLDYAHSHGNTERNKHILKLVIFEGYSYVDAAQAVGCDDAVVGYVVREAQKYARERRREQQ